MNIGNLITENYKIAKSKGFYPLDSTVYDHMLGINEEFGECSTAQRNNQFCSPALIKELVNTRDIYTNLNYGIVYSEGVSGTFEDEVTDLFIRLLNLSGHYVNPLNYNIIIANYNKDYEQPPKSVTEFLVKLQFGSIRNIFIHLQDGVIPAGEIGRALKTIALFCESLGIPLHLHILAKMEYNKTRSFLHGKIY